MDATNLDAESFMSKGNDYSKKLNSIPIESKKNTPNQSLNASNIPPLEELNKSIPPLEKLNNSIPPLEELNNSIPPLEELNNSIPAKEKSASPYVSDSSFNSSHIPTPQELSFNNSQMSFPQEASLSNSSHPSITQSLINRKLDEYFFPPLNKSLTGSIKNSPLNQSKHSPLNQSRHSSKHSPLNQSRHSPKHSPLNQSRQSLKNTLNRSDFLDDIFKKENIAREAQDPFNAKYAATLARLANLIKGSK